MPLYDKLFKKDKQTEPVGTEQFDKFSQLNKGNLGPNTDFNVAGQIKDAYQGAQDLRSKAIDKIIENTNFQNMVPEADTSTATKYGKMGVDMIMPDVSDALPLGKASHAIMPILGMAGKEAKVINKASGTAEDLIQNIRKADSSDLRSGSNLIGKPVFATPEEKALGFGKVTTPDIGTNVGHNEIMKVLNESPTYKNLINDRELFKTNPSAYDAQKQALINKAREYLIQKASK